ncbi:hypothetical protein EDC96DRAFT_544952 [Choanephora cucurbitarum]|nr:hypothetical protein EDC96DRAFT_544952 [Choanephora cucurbitarum]
MKNILDDTKDLTSVVIYCVSLFDLLPRQVINRFEDNGSEYLKQKVRHTEQRKRVHESECICPDFYQIITLSLELNHLKSVVAYLQLILSMYLFAFLFFFRFPNLSHYLFIHIGWTKQAYDIFSSNIAVRQKLNQFFIR